MMCSLRTYSLVSVTAAGRPRSRFTQLGGRSPSGPLYDVEPSTATVFIYGTSTLRARQCKASRGLEGIVPGYLRYRATSHAMVSRWTLVLLRQGCRARAATGLILKQDPHCAPIAALPGWRAGFTGLRTLAVHHQVYDRGAHCFCWPHTSVWLVVCAP